MYEFYPRPITDLPKAYIPFEGVKDWLSQGPDHQGDTYFIPADVLHSAVFRQKTWLMDFFADGDRCKTK
jgi:hypothetical protein